MKTNIFHRLGLPFPAAEAYPLELFEMESVI